MEVGLSYKHWDEERIKNQFAKLICLHGSRVLKWKTINSQVAKVILRAMKDVVPTYNAMELTDSLFG
jgi:hypothetical protein